MEYFSNSSEQSGEIVTALATSFHGGDVVAMYGELGSGKTTSTKYLARYFGVEEEITSPTFVIMKNYTLPKSKQGVTEIAHLDAYRLRNAEDAEEIGLSDYFQRKDVLIIIEWPENIATMIPGRAKEIKFEHLGGDKRKITANF